jgi:hypothetical protein
VRASYDDTPPSPQLLHYLRILIQDYLRRLYCLLAMHDDGGVWGSILVRSKFLWSQPLFAMSSGETR